MGILDDLAMGFGLKPRTQDYDARTARGAAIDAAVGNAPQQMAGMIASTLNAGGTISPSSSMYQYLDKSAFSGSDDSGGYSGAQLFGEKSPAYNKYLTDRGYEAGYIPQVGSTALSGPNPYAIGPFTSANPIRLPGILGLITGGLFGQRDREVPTVSADGGPMRVRPRKYQRYNIPNSLTDDDMGLPDFPSSVGLEGPKYPSRADYLLRYGNDGLLADPEPTTADLMESHIPLDSEVETTDYGPGDDNTMSFEEYVESVSSIDNLTGMPVDKSPEAMRRSFERFLKRTGMQERVFDPIKYNYDRYKANGGTMTFGEFKAYQGG